MSIPLISVEALTPDTFAPYGWVLGKRTTTSGDDPYYQSQSLSIWREHLFDAGEANETEILWTSFGDDSELVQQLEARHLTQQVTVPLTAPLIQIVATSEPTRVPNMTSLRHSRFQWPWERAFAHGAGTLHGRLPALQRPSCFPSVLPLLT